ncbi:MAG: 2'-5' RNA ligase family protein [Oleispira antarctica]|nr:2'-5' RNA ligase family protein [Oleispira antarctica]MBQ0793314.1 2'-5' RNA ligase family protein [Oleispira antarctica]|tara:strand:+ start:1030 stop:1674 length:645 start_codon:yes stop_codon:yes gene_type:complete
MHDLILDNEITQPTELRDFFEWHQGIKHYGFWAIEIHHPNCLQQILLSQQQLSNKLHPNYLRQPHITLSASGLLDDKHFTQASLQQQIKKLKESNLSAFSLNLSKGHSFTTAPYLSISDHCHSLATLRTLFNNICSEQDPSDYIPHITLGFYNQAFKTVDVLTQLATVYSQDIEFMVNEIVFAQYNTHEIQGRYQVLHRIALADSVNNTNKTGR